MPDKLFVSVGTIIVVVAVVILLAGASPRSIPEGPFARESELLATEGRVDVLADEVNLRAKQEELDKTNANFLQLATRVQNCATREELSSMGTQLSKRIANLGNRVDSCATIDMLNQTEVRLTDKIAAVDHRVDEFEREVHDHGVILDAISQMSPEGEYVPSILSNMGVGSFKEQMDRVVSDSIRHTSDICIENMTPTTQRVTVNEGTPRNLAHGEKWRISVPTGNLSTRLPGQDLVNWAIGPPRYSLKLNIVNRGQVVTYHCLPY